MIPVLGRPLTLGFLSPHNPFDRRAFSGTVFFAARALEAHPGIDLRILGGHRPPRRIVDRLLKPREPDVARLDFSGLDAVVGMVASPLLADLADRAPDLPFLHITDATPRFLRDVYGWHVPANADALETRVADAALAPVYSSDFMAARAPRDLDLPGLSPATIPFGVNIEDLPQTCPLKPSLKRLNLLFVGLDWVRKGGDIAIATLEELRADGVDAHLTVIGACPEQHRSNPAVTYLGYLDKNRPAEAQQIMTAYTLAHLLLLPSRGDCTPMVVGEAMAHGTPVVATDTGGIATLIGASGAGALMSEFAAPANWAAQIRAMTADRDTYAFHSDAGFDRARTRLSWSGWARDLEALIRDRLVSTEPEQVKVSNLVELKRCSAAA